MIKTNSAARVLLAVACLTAVGTSVAGCSTTASAAGAGSGTTSGSTQTTANATPSNASANTSTSTNTNTSAASTNPANGSAPHNPAPSTSTAAAAPGAGSGVARCHTSEVSAFYTVVPDSAGAGNISYNLRLTNTSMHQCTIYGFAGMLLLDANHNTLPTHVVWDSLVPKQLLRLNPGGSAAATVRFSPDVPGTGDDFARYGTCEPKAYYTEVTPPDETTQVVTAVSPPTPVCERGTLQVSAFIAGSTGPNQQ